MCKYFDSDSQLCVSHSYEEHFSCTLLVGVHGATAGWVLL